MQHHEKQEPTFFGLDTQVFTDIIACGDVERRTALAHQIAALMADRETPTGELDQVMPIARRLAADEDVSVRRAFAEALSAIETLDADLLFTIVSDDDDIALPFLSATPALDPLRMLAVLRAGGEARQAVVASRPDLSAKAIDAITRELSLPVNAMLLENTAAELGPGHYRVLYKRFGAEPDILERLLARPGLPPVIRIVQARRAATNLHGMLVGRAWLPSGKAAELIFEAEEVATLEVLAAAAPFDLPGAVAFLIDNEMLTPSLIVRAACQGAMHVVAECLAGLSGLPRRRVDVMMFARSRFKALHARCGLPQNCFWTLQAACDVSAGELESGTTLSVEEFGARLVELLLTRYDAMPLGEQPRNLDLVGRYAAEKTRQLATALKSDLQRAA